MSFKEFSRPRLGRMHEVMAGYVDRGEVPGVVTLVSRRDEVHVDTLGTLAANGAGGAMQRDTLFRISSMSKPLVGVAAMILLEECRMRLDDPVERWLPELANRRVLQRLDGPVDETVPAHRAVTVRDLLTMRLGLGYLMTAPGDWPIQTLLQANGLLQGPLRPRETPGPDEWMRRVGTIPLMYQPGERWMYDLSIEVASVLVARVAGKPLEEFMREHIFAPLGMKDTSFSVPPEKIDRFATSYWTSFTSGKVEVFDPAAGGQWSRPPAFPSGAGGLISTVDDYLAFSRMLLGNGQLDGERILSRASVEAMTSNQLTLENRKDTEMFLWSTRGWGLGVSVFLEPDGIGLSAGSFGWDGGMGSSGYIDPKEDVIGILMTQQAWTTPEGVNIMRDFWTSTYQAIAD